MKLFVIKSQESSENYQPLTQLLLSLNQNQWMPLSVSPAGFVVPSPYSGGGAGGEEPRATRKVSHSVATQTVGLFYPSQRQIDKSKEQEEEKVAFEKQMRDRRPLLTAVSPGRGRGGMRI